MSLSLSETALTSSVGSLVARCLCHPLDTIKSRLQAAGSERLYGSLWRCGAMTVREEGLRGLYRGLGAAAVVGTPAGMLYFTSYEWSKRALGTRGFDGGAPGVHFASGLFAEAVACVVFVPVDVVKERVQVHRDYSGSLQCLGDTARKEGAIALYRGYGPTLLSFGTFSGLYFALYEKSKASLGRPGEALPFRDALIAALVAGGAASFFTAPLDLAKLRLQVHRGAAEGTAPLRFTDVFLAAWRTRGLRGLFRGAGARVAFFAPSTAVSMACFETVKGAFLARSPRAPE